MSREKEKNENETAAILGFWVGEYGGRPLILEGTANGNSLILFYCFHFLCHILLSYLLSEVV